MPAGGRRGGSGKEVTKPEGLTLKKKWKNTERDGFSTPLIRIYMTVGQIVDVSIDVKIDSAAIGPDHLTNCPSNYCTSKFWYKRQITL